MPKDIPILAGLVAVGAAIAWQKPFEDALVAKVAFWLGMVNGAYVMLAPPKGAKLYGLQPTPRLLMTIEHIGTTTLSTHVLAYCLLDRETTLNKAIGICATINAVALLKMLLNEEPQKLWMQPGPQISVFLISAAAAQACLMEASYAEMASKIFALRGLVHGVIMTFLPAKAGEAVNVPDSNKYAIESIRLLGVFVLDNGVFCACVLMGMDYMQAYGYAWIPGMVYSFLGHSLLDHANNKIGAKSIAKFFWMTLQVVIVGTLLF